MPQFLTDDELLDVPLGNLVPGELARSFKVHADHTQKSEQAEMFHAMQRIERQTAEAVEREEAVELHHREEAVLAQLAEREKLLIEEAQHLDDRAIKLHDGRRAYVDGERYRDAEGRELTGADRAQAEVLHVERPDATTWQEERRITTKLEEVELAKRKIETAQVGAPAGSEAAAVKSAETLLARSQKIDALPDYGSADIVLPSPALRM